MKINYSKFEGIFHIKHIIIDKKPKLLLCEFDQSDIEQFDNKKLEFTVYLNTDYIYSLLLNYFVKNHDLFHDSDISYTKLAPEDVIALSQYIPINLHE